jgi:thiol-disulfide isomerase/thioredoxin
MKHSPVAILQRFLILLAGFLCVVQLLGQSANEAAPRFNAKTLKGEKFTNESLKGRVVLLQFWTTWCPYCKHDQAMVEKLEKDYSDKGLVILAVDVNESKKTVANYLKEHPRSCRVVLTEDTNLAARFEAKNYPVYIIINKDGNIEDAFRGSAPETGLKNVLRRAGLPVD